MAKTIGCAKMERRLAAIVAADVVGYSRLMGADEPGTLAELNRIRNELITPAVTRHDGRIVKLMGDGILIEFPSVVSAVTCAVELQNELKRQTDRTEPQRRLEFRIGINLGDVMVENNDIYGDGVNVAARLQALAQTGGITISQAVFEHVGNRLKLVFNDRGEHELKNIERPMRIYDVMLDDASTEEIPARGGRPSIAVLPFTNMSGDPEQEYFSDGITEDIITDLSKASGLSVIARHSAFSYKGKALKVQQVGRDLGVGFVVEGSVRRAGTRVRVTGQLVDCTNGSHIWADRFDRELTDIFAIQDEITRAIVDQLKIKLLPSEKESIEQAPTNNVDAYTYYLRGRDFFYRHSQRYFELARRMFAKAAELDPRYARAYAGMAECDSWLYLTYRVNLQVENIIELADKALALNPNLAEPHAARGTALTAAGDFAEASREFERAIELDPGSFGAHFLYARSSMLEGNLERAAKLLERAMEISPNDYQPPCMLIQIYRSFGQFDKAREVALIGLPLAERELTLHPEDPRPAHFGVAALTETGQHDRAREWISRALAIDPEDPATLYNCACAHTKLGDIDQALDLIEQVLQRGSAYYKEWMAHDSDMDGLRQHPRFQELLQKAGSE
jgi:adenylate cyclase